MHAGAVKQEESDDDDSDVPIAQKQKAKPVAKPAAKPAVKQAARPAAKRPKVCWEKVGPGLEDTIDLAGWLLIVTLCLHVATHILGFSRSAYHCRGCLGESD